jgi:hypothetical protein
LVPFAAASPATASYTPSTSRRGPATTNGCEAPPRKPDQTGIINKSDCHPAVRGARVMAHTPTKHQLSASIPEHPLVGSTRLPLRHRVVVVDHREVHTVMWPPVRGLDYMRSASASRQSPAARSSRRSSSSRCPLIAPSPGTTWRQLVSPNAIVSSVLVQVMFSACPSTGIDSG